MKTRYHMFDCVDQIKGMRVNLMKNIQYFFIQENDVKIIKYIKIYDPIKNKTFFFNPYYDFLGVLDSEQLENILEISNLEEYKQHEQENDWIKKQFTQYQLTNMKKQYKKQICQHLGVDDMEEFEKIQYSRFFSGNIHHLRKNILERKDINEQQESQEGFHGNIQYRPENILDLVLNGNSCLVIDFDDIQVYDIITSIFSFYDKQISLISDNYLVYERFLNVHNDKPSHRVQCHSIKKIQQIQQFGDLIILDNAQNLSLQDYIFIYKNYYKKENIHTIIFCNKKKETRQYEGSDYRFFNNFHRIRPDIYRLRNLQNSDFDFTEKLIQKQWDQIPYCQVYDDEYELSKELTYKDTYITYSLQYDKKFNFINDRYLYQDYMQTPNRNQKIVFRFVKNKTTANNVHSILKYFSQVGLSVKILYLKDYILDQSQITSDYIDIKKILKSWSYQEELFMKISHVSSDMHQICDMYEQQMNKQVLYIKKKRVTFILHVNIDNEGNYYVKYSKKNCDQEYIKKCKIRQVIYQYILQRDVFILHDGRRERYQIKQDQNNAYNQYLQSIGLYQFSGDNHSEFLSILSEIYNKKDHFYRNLSDEMFQQFLQVETQKL